MNAPCHAVTAEAAADLAALHAEAFGTGDAWGEDAIRLMLGLPGAFGAWQPRCGFVLARSVMQEAEILTLAVIPAARRQGLGTALMRAAMSEAARRGAEALFLEVAEANVAAVGLYDRLRFSPVGRRRDYYGQGRDALVLRRDLS